MDKEILYKIILAGSKAPSGSNSQPWKFRVKDNVIEVIALPEKDHPVLNYKNRGTYIAHGALLENMEIAANYFGYEMNYQIFPEKDLSFKITLKENKSLKDKDGLYEAIFKRSTNRKHFSLNQLKKEEKEFLFKEVSKFNQCELVYVEDRDKIQEIAKELAWDTYLNLSNKELHKLMFNEIIWSQKEEKERGGHGLFVKTMELKPQEEKAFKLLKNWTIASLFKKLGILKNIYKSIFQMYLACGLFGFIAVNNKDEDFIYAGKLMENIWLRATKLGLGFHLITGIPFLWQGINFGDLKIFSDKEKELINNIYSKVKNISGFKKEVLALNFRLGYSEGPSAYSFKKEPEIEFI